MSIFEYLSRNREIKGEVWYNAYLTLTIDFWFTEDPDVIRKYSCNFPNMLKWK